MKRLCVLESERAIAILEDSIEKVKSLESNKIDILRYQNDLAKTLGNDVSKSVKFYKSQELDYNNLLELRAEIKTTTDKRRYKEVQGQIEDLNLILKESKYDLTKALRENPNISRNTLKFSRDRTDLIDLLLRCVQELRDHRTFTSIISKVEEEMNAQMKLRDLKLQEKSLREIVFFLQQQLVNDQISLQDNITKKKNEIAQLRHEIHTIRTSTSINSSFQRKESQANVAALCREYKLLQRELEFKIDEAENRLKNESLACEETKSFLVRKNSKLKDELITWENKFDRDINKIEDELKKTSQEYSELLQKLNLLRERNKLDMLADQESIQNAIFTAAVELEEHSSRLRRRHASRCIFRAIKMYIEHRKAHYPVAKKKPKSADEKKKSAKK